MSKEFEYDVIIIGAGLSGIQTAKRLQSFYGVSSDRILVLEAQDYVGGRIRQNTDWIKGIKVELGAEIMHGKGTSLTKFAEENKIPYSQIFCWAHGDGGPHHEPVNNFYGLYWFGNGTGQGKLLRFDDKDPEFTTVNDYLWGLGDRDSSKVCESKTLLEDMLEHKLNPQQIRMANAGFSNTLCASAENLSLKQCIEWVDLWRQNDDGEFKYKQSYSVLINYVKNGVNIKLNTPVTKVQQIECKENNKSCKRVIVHTLNGQQYRSKTVCVTISSGAMKTDYIKFEPKLPSHINLAYDSLDMCPAVKVFIKFSKVCWPKHLQGMVMSDPTFLFPEIWLRDCTEEIEKGEQAVCYATGFATTHYAEKILSMPREEVYKAFVNQLETIFSNLEPRHCAGDLKNIPKQVNLPKLSEHYLGGMLQEWSHTKPFISGGYCSPRVGYPSTSAAVLSEPCNDVLFFAGEHTSNPAETAHAALDSGTRAANCIASYLQLKPSTLKAKL